MHAIKNLKLNERREKRKNLESRKRLQRQVDLIINV
jgi:hypothetical protein